MKIINNERLYRLVGSADPARKTSVSHVKLRI